ncbi:MAG: glycosyltransferase family 4 protein [Alphaproteobacteria bacterium]|nr:glycosyltransferase family 4 protein [Alphaproteobacteria bacterium]
MNPPSHSNRTGPLRKPTASAAARAARTAVLHLLPDMELGMGTREVVDLAVQTHRGGWRPLVASSGGALVLEAERSAVRHTRMPLNRHHFVARWRSRVQLAALVQRERPALVHAHGFEVLSMAHSINLLHRLPILVDLTEPSAVTPRRRKLLQAMALRGARFRVPSDFMAQHLRQDFKLKTDFLYHIPPGIDMHWFDVARVTPERLHTLSQLWRLPELATIIVMATPLAPGFGHRELLEAMVQIQRKDVFAVLVGDDRPAPGTRAEIEKLVTTLGLEGRVIMPEQCPDWPAACWLASLIVAANQTPRGQGIELLAAQAMGRPVIVTQIGANPEMVQSGATAWVVPPGDGKALAGALAEATGMTGTQRIDLALRTRDFIANMFPQTVWVESIFELYGAMLAQPMAPLPTRAA